MLVLSRKVLSKGVFVQIGDVRVRVSIQEIRGNTVRLGFEGPEQAEFLREELLEDDTNQQDKNGK